MTEPDGEQKVCDPDDPPDVVPFGVVRVTPVVSPVNHVAFLAMSVEVGQKMAPDGVDSV